LMSTAMNGLDHNSSVRVLPVKQLRGKLRLPGDKSISHRAAILAALPQEGISRISNFSTGADCQSTLRCLERLGVRIERQGDAIVCIEGTGARGFVNEPKTAIDCGNSGSTMRMLAGALAGQNIVATLTGDESLRSRPMQRIIEPLEFMGAEISTSGDRPPLTVKGQHPLRPISYEMPIASAQVKSAILFASLNASGRTEIVEPNATRDHTERLLRCFGLEIEIKRISKNSGTALHIAIQGLQRFGPRDISVPGDVSSAAFFIAAAAVLPNSEVEITSVGLNPTRIAFLRTLQLLGAQVRVETMRDERNEPVGSVYVTGSGDLVPLAGKANLVCGPMVAQLIDELPLLAVVGTRLQGGLEIRDATELRFKESDRIATTVRNLRAMGAEVEEFPDGLAVTGPTRLRGAVIDSFGDHRIVMAFAVAALMAAGESEIRGADCVRVSFPEFFRLLDSLIH
jgi:3-phosphoshikimate 1-carboxyvinyltransferase